MTQLVHDTAAIPVGQAEQEILQKLIKEGLTPATDGDHGDFNRYRKLLEVLFQACLLAPIGREPSELSFEQADYTLTILSRQTAARPELLSCLPARPDPQIPLYKWIIPRLISAVLRYDGISGAEVLVENLVSASVQVLHVLGRDLSDEHTSYARGPRQVILALEHMLDVSQDICDGKTTQLFAFPETSFDPLVVFIILEIVFRSGPAVATHVGPRACAQLIKALHFVKSNRNRQTRYAITLTLAIEDLSGRLSLAPACTAVARWPVFEDKAWQNAVCAFFKALSCCDASLRSEVWWALRDRCESLHIMRGVMCQMIDHLVRPIEAWLPVDGIKDLIPDGVLERWSKEVTLIEGPECEQIAEHLRWLKGLTGDLTKKRKRTEDVNDGQVARLLRDRLPNLSIGQGDVQHALLDATKAADGVQIAELASISADVFCIMAGCQLHRPPFNLSLSDECLDVLASMLSAFMSTMTLLRAVERTFEHMPPVDLSSGLQLTSRQTIMERVWASLQSSERRIRIAAGRIVSITYLAQDHHPNQKIASTNRQLFRRRIEDILNQASPQKETAILLLGNLGRLSKDLDLCSVLELLLNQLGSRSAPIRSLAFTELLAQGKYHGKTPYTLLSPFLDRISVFLANNLVRNPDLFGEAMQFIGYTRQNFIQTTIRYSVPALIISRNRGALELIAAVVKQGLGVILLDNISHILSAVFLHPLSTENSLAFLIDLLRDLTRGQPNMDLSASSLMRTCIVPFVVSLVVELGDEDQRVSTNASAALRKAQAAHSSDIAGVDLGAFLKPHMLGVISQLNEMLHDVQGKKTVIVKRKIIRSLGVLIELVGDSMASFSPQIMASLQSTLGITELREETLKTWALFVKTLRYADLGPFIGRTTGALVASWDSFSPSEKALAIGTIEEIAGNAQHLTAYFDDVVGMDDIPELKSAALKLTENRRAWDIRTQLGKLLDRIKSKNTAIATISMKELRSVLRIHQSNIIRLSLGDTFDSIIARTMHNLVSAATRDGDCQELRDLSYECIGIIGALDPDRLISQDPTPAMTLMYNFADQDESIDFAIHLVRDLLVDAFRATNDTKHQNHLAFAIQELLSFCGFTPKILQPSSATSLKLRSKWQMIPKDQLETITPLLESRFSLNDNATRTFPHPIYLVAPTYREWLQMWTMDLIGKIMSWPSDARAIHDSQTIFGVCRGILRNQDVTVAYHLLPHLVLNVLLSGDRPSRKEIYHEINTVLQDQVNPTGGKDKRMLSAQVVFDLMDHLSTWLRLQRVGRADRGAHVRIVEGVLSGIETELMANAALQSKAFARSLRNFEQRIVQLRKEKRANIELQTYFERLHQIYAELDEPDGMEGVSAFVISPSLEHQIREHESTGRWTSAQSCWEVRLQQSPDDVNLHLGLLKCLRNLGHYDTLRTHIRGVLSRRPDWLPKLASFEAEAAWIIGDWETIRQVGKSAPPVAQVLLAWHDEQDLPVALSRSRRDLGLNITSNHYFRSYDSVLQLHLLREIESIHDADISIRKSCDSLNREAINLQTSRQLTKTLEARFATTSSAFRVREAILSIRRTAFGLVSSSQLKPQIGHAWIQSSKIARKAGYEQTAYSATLQAKEAEAPFAFIQQAKLLHEQVGAFKALTDLDNAVNPLIDVPVIDVTDDGFIKDRNQAKAVLLQARWANETDRFDQNEIIGRYRKAIQLAPNLESPYYHLGHYYDSMLGVDAEHDAGFNYQTCVWYSLALQHGVKYIYQTMPRMLTLWLDLGESKDMKRYPEVHAHLNKITALLDKARKELAAYQFFTAYPQIVSRIGHPNKDVAACLRKIMALVIAKYPQQALWPSVGVMQSNRPERKTASQGVFTRAQHGDPAVASMIRHAERLSGALLKLADDNKEDKKRDLTISSNFPYVKVAVPSRMIIPLQDALTCSLPSTPETVMSHNAFPMAPVEIQGFDERVEVMPSLQKPKKLIFIGTDGRRYPFLCKPHDDLRKDARLMDFNSMINKLLKSTSESRRRQLYIRTYAVMPLNEECGLLEWVSNTNALKGILEQGYSRHGKKLYTTELATLLETSRKAGTAAMVDTFKEKVIPMYNPTVFHEWFLLTWPEPSAWLASRTAYARTLAVMSMIGYVLGLGDRHGENILFDGLTGDTVHVDLNCLFDKGKLFEIPERVPFRLTHNMVDALGVTGVEGVFRKAGEITLNLLRANSDSLMSVLEAFAHDPLVEWTKSGRGKSENVRNFADKSLKPIKNKLRGVLDDTTVVSVSNHVESLIKRATNPSNLAVMYQGWAPWL